MDPSAEAAIRKDERERMKRRLRIRVTGMRDHALKQFEEGPVEKRERHAGGFAAAFAILAYLDDMCDALPETEIDG